MKVYSLEQSEGWGENHHIVALFSSPEAREKFLTDCDLVDTEYYAYRDVSGNDISGWAAWHTHISWADTEFMESEDGDLFLASTEEEAIEVVLKRAREVCYGREYEVLG